MKNKPDIHFYIMISILILSMVASGIGLRVFQDRITVEQRKNTEAYHNLDYEIYSHEEDIYLLKHENESLRLRCGK